MAALAQNMHDYFIHINIRPPVKTWLQETNNLKVNITPN